MSLKIVTYPNPLLGKPSLPITEVTDEIRKLAEEMTEAMYKSDGIGIARAAGGPAHPSRHHRRHRPRKARRENGAGQSRMDAPSGRRVCGKRGRLPLRARLPFQGPPYRPGVHVEPPIWTATPSASTPDDILAICVQHEIDHLDGKLFIDRISRLKRIMFENKLKKGTRQSQVK